MKKYLVIICLMVGLTASAQNGEVFSVLKLEPQATAPTNAFWTNGSLYRGTDGVIYHKKDGSWEPLGGTTTEIVNNLTSTDTDKALSAAQGKVLKDLIDANATLNLSQVLSNGNDGGFNDITNIDNIEATGINVSHGSVDNVKNIKMYSTDIVPTATKGNFYFDDSESTLKQYNGTAWEALNGGGTDDQTASEVPITDSGDYFTGTDVEAALQELGAGTAGGSFGIVAEGTFDTTSGAGTYTVTHSLGYAPAVTRIQIQQYDKPGCCANQPTAIENITTTTFDVKTTTTSGFYYAWRIFGTGSTTPLDFTEVASGLDTELGSTDWRTGGTPADGSISTAKLADGAVTSTKILDGTILDADINAAAGIDATKIADGSISNTEFQYVNGATSNLQNQIDAKISGTIAGRTGTMVSGIMIQTEAQLNSDGAPDSDEAVFCSNCPPAKTTTGTVLDMSGFNQTDDTAVDTSTFTLTDIRPGGYHEVRINKSGAAPTITGATQLPDTTAFVADTDMLLCVKAFGSTVKYFFVEL